MGARKPHDDRKGQAVDLISMETAGRRSPKILLGKEEISAYCGISMQRLEKLLRVGHFPARMIGRGYMAHTDLLDAWIRRVTSSPGGASDIFG